MSRLRILAILNASVRGYAGGDLHTVSVMNKLAENNDVDIYLPRGSSPELIRIISSRIRVRARPRRGGVPPRPLYLCLLAARTLAASWYVLMRPRKWDVVIASSHFAFDAIPMLLARGPHKRALYWWHHLSAPLGRPRWTELVVRMSEAFLTRLLERRQIYVLAGNSYTQEWLIGRGVPRALVGLTTNGPSFQCEPIEDEDAFRINPALRALQGKKIELFFARLSNLKGAQDLPEIARQTLAMCRDACLVVCGSEGEEAAAVRQDLRELELEGRVVFMGFVDEVTKRWLFDHAHVLISPSYEEGWGITVADALVCGAWVVTYELAAVQQANPTGPLYVQVGDVAAFVAETVACLQKERPIAALVSPGREWAEIAACDLNAMLATA